MGSLETTKTATFSQKAENYLLDVCWTREETSKATASDVISQISREFKRRHQSEMLSKTDRLIQQQIARYFSRLSAVTKIALLMRSPSVNMNEDGEADANDLASEFETDRTRQKISKDLAKFRQRLQERVQLLLSLKKKRHLHLTFLSHLLSLLTKTTDYVLGFHQGKFAGRLFVKLLLAHSYLKILQVTQLNAGNTRSREM